MKITNKTISKCFSILGDSDSMTEANTERTLVTRLHNGLAQVCTKDSKVAYRYSFQKKLEHINQNLLASVNNSEYSKPTTTNSKVKVLEQEINEIRDKQMGTVPIGKFESVCQELEGSLKREEQAQAILNKQSIQLEELAQKLSQASTEELQTIKLKDVNNIF